MPDILAYIFVALGVLSGLSVVFFRKEDGTAQTWTILLALAVVIATAFLNLLQVMAPLGNVAIICVGLGAVVSVFTRKTAN